MADLQCYITTFNCGRSLIDVSYFARHLLDGLAAGRAASALPPDLIVLCLQEVAPIGYSFLGGSFLAPYFTRFSNAVQEATRSRFSDGASYETIAVRNVGMTAIMLFAKADVVQRINGLEAGGVGVGFWDMGNKGAVGLRLGFREEQTQLTFVAAHLAPMEDACDRRNQDWKAINEGLVFQKTKTISQSRPWNPQTAAGTESESEPLLSSATDDSNIKDKSSSSGMFAPKSHLFFAGDLNYRTSDTSPSPDAYEKWPQPSTTTSDAHHFSHLLEKDQLSRELHSKRTLHYLTEAPIDFPPTYKYSSAAQKQAAQRAGLICRNVADDAAAVKSDDDDDQVWLWAKHRTPSWCDRVLYLPESSPEVRAYTALPLQPTSDHRPVVLSFSIPEASLKDGSTLAVKPPFDIKPGWVQRRSTARMLELIVGLGAYLALTWEGEALLLGTVVGIVGGAVALRALLGY